MCRYRLGDAVLLSGTWFITMVSTLIVFITVGVHWSGCVLSVVVWFSLLALSIWVNIVSRDKEAEAVPQQPISIPPGIEEV